MYIIYRLININFNISKTICISSRSTRKTLSQLFVYTYQLCLYTYRCIYTCVYRHVCKYTYIYIYTYMHQCHHVGIYNLDSHERQINQSFHRVPYGNIYVSVSKTPAHVGAALKLQCVAECCSMLQRVAACCSVLFWRMHQGTTRLRDPRKTLQHTETHRNTPQHIENVGNCNTLQYTTYCNPPQPTATHRNTLNDVSSTVVKMRNSLQHITKKYDTMQHCNILQHTATHYDTYLQLYSKSTS